MSLLQGNNPNAAYRAQNGGAQIQKACGIILTSIMQPQQLCGVIAHIQKDYKEKLMLMQTKFEIIVKKSKDSLFFELKINTVYDHREL